MLNLFNALITPGPIASPQDLSLGNTALSIIPILKFGFKFLNEIAVLEPDGPAPTIKTSYIFSFFIIYDSKNTLNINKTLIYRKIKKLIVSYLIFLSLLDCALVKNNNKIPPATVKRLPLYLQCLELIDDKTIGISSKKLAELAKVNDAQVRRDLSYLGTLGTRGVGYEVSTLRNQLQLELGLVEGWSAVIVGVGNLGSALAHYGGFQERGFGVVGLFDDDPRKINKQIAGLVVKPISEMQNTCEKYNVAIGIIATPGKVAQEIADKLIECNIKSILNFAPVLLKNTADVQIRSVDLSQELQILSYYLDRPVLKAVK